MVCSASRLREASWPLWVSVAQRRDHTCPKFSKEFALSWQMHSLLPPRGPLPRPELAMAHSMVCEAEDPEGTAAPPWEAVWLCRLAHTRRLPCPAKAVIKASGARELLRQIQPKNLSITLRITVLSDLILLAFYWQVKDKSESVKKRCTCSEMLQLKLFKGSLFNLLYATLYRLHILSQPPLKHLLQTSEQVICTVRLVISMANLVPQWS